MNGPSGLHMQPIPIVTYRHPYWQLLLFCILCKQMLLRMRRTLSRPFTCHLFPIQDLSTSVHNCFLVDIIRAEFELRAQLVSQFTAPDDEVNVVFLDPNSGSLSCFVVLSEGEGSSEAPRGHLRNTDKRLTAS